MQIPFFTLDRQHLSLRNELENAYSNVISKGQFVMGEEVKKFEVSFAQHIGTASCISCGNGTDALELILRGLELKSGMEVIIPANTWMSVAEAVVNSGGIPRFIDVDPETFNMDLDKLDSLINEHTFAVIAVHQFGNPIDLTVIKNNLESQGVFLIEDCAHAAGAAIGGKMCGTYGDAAAFSFYPTKNLGALGDGGAITTSNGDLVEKLKLLRNHGQISRDVHALIGRNSRLDEIQAAILNVKINHLDGYNRRRGDIANMYCDGLELIGNNISKNSHHVYHQYVIRHNNRDRLANYLEEQGIGTAIHYPKAILDLGVFDCKDTAPIAGILSQEILSIPIFPELLDEEVHYIIDRINSFD